MGTSQTSSTETLQGTSLQVLKSVQDICADLGISYYAGEGTLLGAVRHQGFVPWDDDIDLLMPRRDYDIFVAEATELLRQRGLRLHCFETDSSHYTICAKVRTTTDVGYVQENVLHLYDEPYPGIDIFPLDFVPARSSWPQAVQGRVVQTLRRLLWARQGILRVTNYKRRRVKLARYYIPMIACRFISTKCLHRLIDRSMRAFNGHRSRKYVVNLGSYYNRLRQTHPVHVYGVPRQHPFVNGTIAVPADPHFILTSVYGDYMKLPPLSARNPRHGYIERTTSAQGNARG